MFATGSWEEVTAPLKHANLPRFNHIPVFPSEWPSGDEKKRPWRVTEWKLGAAVRKEARVRCDGQAEVIA